MPPIWTGMYAGLHGGGNWIDSTIDPFASSSYQGGAFGGHLGLLTELGWVVVGVEADLDFKSADAEAAIDVTIPGLLSLSGTARSSMSANGTLRARIGVPLAHNVLLYATGGYAWATVDASVDASVNGSAISLASGATLNGIVYGAGLEGFLTPNVLLRVEYLHTDYQDQVLSLPIAGYDSMKIETRSDVVRAGVTWRFN